MALGAVSMAESVLVLVLGVCILIPALVGFLLGRSAGGGVRSEDAKTAGTQADNAARSGTSAVAVVDSQYGRSADNGRLVYRLRDAFDHIDHAVVVADQDGEEVFANSAAERLRESRDGRVLIGSAAAEMLREALAGKTQEREIDLFGPPSRTFAISARPLSGSAGRGALAVVEDVTMRRVTETVRRDFVANISHELKSPIGAMGLLADMIQAEPDTDVVTRLATRMVNEAERASRTIDDLLELASIEFAGEVDFVEVPVAEIIAEAVARIASSAEQANVQLVVDDRFESSIVGDRIQLVSAIYNLLDNAVKYSMAGSKVTIACDEASKPGMVSFSVTDTGVGIPRRDLDRIFERFYRVDRARSRGTGGTGLGLAIVRHVANNHAGQVTVSSTEGFGATFTLTIAAVPGDAV